MGVLIILISFLLSLFFLSYSQRFFLKKNFDPNPNPKNLNPNQKIFLIL